MTIAPHRTLGVGFVGAGPVVQAIHLPTLARSRGRLAPVHVMDIDADLAAAVAGPCGARSSSRLEDLLADPAVDIVAICSPHHLHAEQAIAAIGSGKRAVLVEKPYATSLDDAEAINSAARAAGVPVLVGAMHLVDPGWLASEEIRSSLRPEVRFIRSSITLPPNTQFEDRATEVVRPARPGESARSSTREFLRGMILGLAIHDVPLIRRELPGSEDAVARPRIDVLHAEAAAPGGYLIRLRVDEVLLELHAQSSPHARLEWTLELVAERDVLLAHFPPSYVHAGGAQIHHITPAGTVTLPPETSSAYEREWSVLADAADSGTAPASLADLTADLRFALDIADAVDAHLAHQEVPA